MSSNSFIIPGKEIAENIQEKIALFVEEQSKKNIFFSLATILVGDHPASQVYINNKIKACEKVGIVSNHKNFSDKTSFSVLKEYIDTLNQDSFTDGILLQLPLPESMSKNATDRLLCSIFPQKDVDGFHHENISNLVQNKECFIPCTAQGCLHLLKKVNKNLVGKKVLIIGRSQIVGKPLALLLLHENATITMAHSYTENLKEECHRADIIICAAGQPNLLTKDYFQPHHIIIDVGINRLSTPDGPILQGDVDFQAAQNIVKAITPVPKGVGPMTIACLLANTIKAGCQRRNISLPNFFI